MIKKIIEEVECDACYNDINKNEPVIYYSGEKSVMCLKCALEVEFSGDNYNFVYTRAPERTVTIEENNINKKFPKIISFSIEKIIDYEISLIEGEKHPEDIAISKEIAKREIIFLEKIIRRLKKI